MKVDRVVREGGSGITSIYAAGGQAIHITDSSANFTGSAGSPCTVAKPCEIMISPPKSSDRRLWALGTTIRGWFTSEPYVYSAGDEWCCCRAGCPKDNQFCQFVCKTFYTACSQHGGGDPGSGFTYSRHKAAQPKCLNTKGSYWSGYQCAATCPEHS